jgi:hypothetical protein
VTCNFVDDCGSFEGTSYPRLQGRNDPEDERMCFSKMMVVSLHGIIAQITTK